MSQTFGNWTPAMVDAHNAKISGKNKLPPAPADATLDEAKLHDEIMTECANRMWICFHGMMTKKTHRTPGEPDFIILADKKRVFLFECKSKKGKLSTEQLAMKLWAERLGHTIHIVRSFTEFKALID